MSKQDKDFIDPITGLITEDDDSVDESGKTDQPGESKPETIAKAEEEKLETTHVVTDTSYRPSTDSTKQQKKTLETGTVPLAVFLELKNDFKELKKNLVDDALTNKELEDFAESSGIDVAKAAQFVEMIKKSAKEEILQEVDARVNPIVSEKITSDNETLFNADFERTIVSKYPELSGMKEKFKAIAFSKDFIHLQTLEDIRKEFFSTVQSQGVDTTKKETTEGGSTGASDKAGEEINFEHPTDAQHAKILADPILREKYYDWQDSHPVR